MPHQNPSLLLPDETLEHSEFLVSPDGRFRLYLEQDGNLMAYSYGDDKVGIRRFWSTNLQPSDLHPPIGPPTDPADIRLCNTIIAESPADVCAIALMNSSGHVFWGPGFFGAATFLYNNDVFQIQNDGNIVHCVRKKDTNEVVAHWAPGTDSQFAQPVAIPPNTPVVEVPNPWVIAIHPVPGATTVVNKTDIPVAARDKNKVVSIPPAGTICIPNTEQTALHLAFYRYDDLRAKDGTTPRNDNQNSDDATRAVPPGAVVEITSSAKLALA